MVWANWARKPGNDVIVGLDLNAGRARAIIGAFGLPPRPAILDEPNEELSLALDLEGRNIRVGAGALEHRRRAPHLLCSGFLPLLGHPRQWIHARHKLDANSAFALVAEALRKPLDGVGAVYASLPAYLTATQVKLARSALESARLPIAGSTTLPLALASRHDSRRGSILVFDADDHASTWTLLSTDAKQVRVLGITTFANYGIRAWVDRLMAHAADRCVRLCRRDPRDSAIAEQSLDEQLTAYLSHARHTQPLPINVRTEHWFQTLVLTPEEIEKACLGLARTVADGVRAYIAETPTPPETLLVTASASKLPGIAGLVNVRLPERTTIQELGVHAPAEAAHALAIRRAQGELPAGHLDAVLPRAPLANDRIAIR